MTILVRPNVPTAILEYINIFLSEWQYEKKIERGYPALYDSVFLSIAIEAN